VLIFPLKPRNPQLWIFLRVEPMLKVQGESSPIHVLEGLTV
jgi:hypothetical protein